MLPLQGALRGGSSPDRATRRIGRRSSWTGVLDAGALGPVTYRSTAVETGCEERAVRVSLGNTRRGGGEAGRHQTHHDSPCAASWGSCGRFRRQAHADRGTWPRPRRWRPCSRSRSSSPWLRLPSLSSGRDSHWISTLRNGRRVRSSFEQGRRLLAGIGGDSMAVPTRRLLLWCPPRCCPVLLPVPCPSYHQHQHFCCRCCCCAVPRSPAAPRAVSAACGG